MKRTLDDVIHTSQDNADPENVTVEDTVTRAVRKLNTKYETTLIMAEERALAAMIEAEAAKNMLRWLSDIQKDATILRGMLAVLGADFALLRKHRTVGE